MTQETQKIVHQLGILFEKQEKALNKMLNILNQEYHALENNDRESFDLVLEKKELHAKALEELEKEFSPVIATIGGTIDRKSLENFIDSVQNPPDKQELIAKWENFLAALNKCHEQNMINYRIVESSKVNIQQALNIIRGDTGLPRLYEASGKENTDIQGQSLAVA